MKRRQRPIVAEGSFVCVVCVVAAGFINYRQSPLNLWFGNNVDDYVPRIIMVLLVIYPHKHASLWSIFYDDEGHSLLYQGI